jgi:hypothetical protein
MNNVIFEHTNVPSVIGKNASNDTVARITLAPWAVQLKIETIYGFTSSKERMYNTD